jgi:hypothetical protein
LFTQNLLLQFRNIYQKLQIDLINLTKDPSWKLSLR